MALTEVLHYFFARDFCAHVRFQLFVAEHAQNIPCAVRLVVLSILMRGRAKCVMSDSICHFYFTSTFVTSLGSAPRSSPPRYLLTIDARVIYTCCWHFSFGFSVTVLERCSWVAAFICSLICIMYFSIVFANICSFPDAISCHHGGRICSARNLLFL